MVVCAGAASSLSGRLSPATSASKPYHWPTRPCRSASSAMRRRISATLPRRHRSARAECAASARPEGSTAWSPPHSPPAWSNPKPAARDGVRAPSARQRADNWAEWPAPSRAWRCTGLTRRARAAFGAVQVELLTRRVCTRWVLAARRPQRVTCVTPRDRTWSVTGRPQGLGGSRRRRGRISSAEGAAVHTDEDDSWAKQPV